ncbi:MAG: MobQ family relaxase, partial [Tabrizicola sp.]
MASYHLSVKTIKRSAGRSATAAAAYRSASVIECDRERRMHDYTAKRGVEACFILTPADAPSWAQDRAALWNAAEARETRSNSVTAREWELALPSELSDAARSDIARAFAQQLVERYGVAADVAIHAPHREGDQRNHHAHILTTTRVLSAEGLTDKTRILDAASTGGPEIEVLRGYWAELQNH